MQTLNAIPHLINIYYVKNSYRHDQQKIYTNISIKYKLIIVPHKQSKGKISYEPNLHKKELFLH